MSAHTYVRITELSELNALIYSLNTYLLGAYYMSTVWQPLETHARNLALQCPWSYVSPLSELLWMGCFHVSMFGLTSHTTNSLSLIGLIIVITSLSGVETYAPTTAPHEQDKFTTYLSN